MGIFDKIKNALFEEEYVEVEEKPKKVKNDVPRVPVEEEKPIAKKVVLPEKREVKIETFDDDDDSEMLDDDFTVMPEPPMPVVEEASNFVDLNDDIYEVEREVEPKIVKVIEKEEVPPVVLQPKEEVRYYQGKKEKEKQPYGVVEPTRVADYGRNENYVQPGVYERKEDRTHFKPSPIISPIYGILDKNYKKEDVVSKREVRLTSSYARENLSVDDVRRKAYGNTNEENKVVEKIEPEESLVPETENLLVDLSDENEKPAVKEVTVGDALEYFEDLGLEYNVDYVDVSKEKTASRRSNVEVVEEEDLEKDMPILEDIQDEPVMQKTEATLDSDDNLFDLIDSMYKENE